MRCCPRHRRARRSTMSTRRCPPPVTLVSAGVAARRELEWPDGCSEMPKVRRPLDCPRFPLCERGAPSCMGSGNSAIAIHRSGAAPAMRCCEGSLEGHPVHLSKRLTCLTCFTLFTRSGTQNWCETRRTSRYRRASSDGQSLILQHTEQESQQPRPMESPASRADSCSKKQYFSHLSARMSSEESPICRHGYLQQRVSSTVFDSGLGGPSSILLLALAGSV